MAGRSEKPLLGSSGLGVDAGEKLIKLGVAEVVFVVTADDDRDFAKPKPDGVAVAEAEVVLVVAKLYAGGASTFGALGVETTGVVPNEKPPFAFSGAFDSTETGAGFVGVWKLKVALLSVGLAGVPKLNPSPALGNDGLGGSILPKPGSLIGSLINAAIPLGLGTITSVFFCSTCSSGFAASTVSLITV